jgi:charged multivesicular body protein 4
MNLFGKRKAPVPNLAESVRKLREASEQLEKRRVFLDKNIASTLGEAKQKMAGKDKRGALFLLKRKKMYEKQVEQIYGKRQNLEVQIMALENAGINSDLAKVMSDGSRALDATLAATDIDKVEDIMESVNESMDRAEELSDAMSLPIGPVMDEDELLDELNELESEMETEEAQGVLGQLQEAPAAKVAPTPAAAPKKSTAEEAELRELEALMGM